MIDIDFFKKQLCLLGLKKHQEDIILSIADRAIAAEAKVSCTMGVGDGSGNLFVLEATAKPSSVVGDDVLADEREASLRLARMYLKASHECDEALIENQGLHEMLELKEVELQKFVNRTAIAENELAELKSQSPIAYQYQARDGSWNNFMNEKHRLDTINAVDSDEWPIRELYLSPQPAITIHSTDVPMFQAAVSGLWYEDPAACGKVIAVTFGAKHFKLPGIEQEAHCSRCGDVGEISVHIPMTMADFENVICPDCGGVEEYEAHHTALKNITDKQVADVCRAFWRRFQPHAVKFGKELGRTVPVEFIAHMATALTFVDTANRKLKDHEVAQLVNEVRDIAIEFGQAQQLRSRIASVLVPALQSVEQLNNFSDGIKQALIQAAQVVAWRAGDISTEDGSYATTSTDAIIRLEEALCEAFSTSSDDVVLEEILPLINALDDKSLAQDIVDGIKIIDLEEFSKGSSDWFTSDEHGVSVIKTDILKRQLNSLKPIDEKTKNIIEPLCHLIECKTPGLPKFIMVASDFKGDDEFSDAFPVYREPITANKPQSITEQDTREIWSSLTEYLDFYKGLSFDDWAVSEQGRTLLAKLNEHRELEVQPQESFDDGATIRDVYFHEKPEPVAGIWHSLKTDPDVYDLVELGVKRYEIRKNDRNFKVGDGLILKKTKYSGEEMRNGLPLEYTGDEFKCAISHVLFGYGLNPEWVILSIAEPVTANKAEVPEDWEMQIYNAMDEGFKVRKDLGNLADGSLDLDDTQLGAEFAMDYFKRWISPLPPLKDGAQ